MLTGLQFTKLRRSTICTLIAVAFFGFITNVYSQENNSSQKNAASSFETKLINIEAAANEPFRYNATLHNGSAQTVTYDLSAQLPAGWLVSFRVAGSQVTSLRVEAGKTEDVSVEISSSISATPNKYKIPVKAVSAKDTLTMNLEAVVKGSYAIEMTTPSGRLSDEVVSGSNKEIVLTVKNTGTLPLNDLELTSQLPTKWGATFDPANIKQLQPGKSTDVKVSLKVPDKTIAGDYVSKFTAKNPNGQSEVSFRIMVKTSLLSGWIGILIIVLAFGLVFYLIRKYGRR